MRTVISTSPRTELKVANVAPVIAGQGEVIVDVHAAGVGRADLIMRQVISGDFVPGIEVAGIVTAAGSGVDLQWVGRRVFARVPSGGYAEQVVAKSAALVTLPKELSFEAAVASGVNALVAHICLAKATVSAGEYVLVRGARGGIGHLVVQMAENLGAIVVKSIKDSIPTSADVVIDLVAGPDTGAFIEQLNANGRYMIAGVSAGMPSPNFAGSLIENFRLSRSVGTMSLDTVSDADLNSAADKIFSDVAAGRVTPIVAQILALEHADQAHSLIAEGGLHGKIVLMPVAGVDTR